MTEEPPPAIPRRRRLRRVTDALRRADWSTVALEIAIVAVGVLLAVQADQWVDARRQRTEERQYLRRLWDETAINIAELEALVRVHRLLADDMKFAAGHLEDTATVPRMTVAGFGCGAMLFPAAKLSTSGYDELSTSNKFDIIRDGPLKQRLRLARAEHEYARAQLEYYRYTATHLLQPYLQTLRWRFDPVTDRPDCRVAWDEVRASPAAQAALIRAHRQHRNMALYRSAELQRVRAVRMRLACVLERPGCPAARR